MNAKEEEEAERSARRVVELVHKMHVVLAGNPIFECFIAAMTAAIIIQRDAELTQDSVAELTRLAAILADDLERVTD